MIVATIVKDEAGEEDNDDNSQASWIAGYEEDPPVCWSILSRCIMLTVSSSRAS
jgi:hypothetical protein